jgi:hypothetical protein
MQESGLVSNVCTHINGLTYPSKYTTDIDSTSRLKSVTQERDLDAFLNSAQLAGTEFTAGLFFYIISTKIMTLLSYRTTECENHSESCRLDAESLPVERARGKINASEAPEKQTTAKSAEKTSVDKGFDYTTTGQTRKRGVLRMAKRIG